VLGGRERFVHEEEQYTAAEERAVVEAVASVGLVAIVFMKIRMLN
jgi:hypothetical protein